MYFKKTDIEITLKTGTFRERFELDRREETKLSCKYFLSTRILWKAKSQKHVTNNINKGFKSLKYHFMA